jgi:CRP-like cAMP-binding protein
VAHTPPPTCILSDFKESYAAYTVRYWLTDLSQPDPTDSLVRTRILLALRRAGIHLSMPAHAVFLTQDDESRHQRKRQEEAESRVVILRQLSLFQGFTDDELKALAPRLRNAPFVRGEAMARQGTVAHSLYILVEGSASVHLAVGEIDRQMATLERGDYFGEMGLLTGAPRSATVIAETNVECLRMEVTGLQEILLSRPELAEHISHTLAQRSAELAAMRAQITQETMLHQTEHSQRALLQRVRDFLGLGRDA